MTAFADWFSVALAVAIVAVVLSVSLGVMWIASMIWTWWRRFWGGRD